MYGRIVGVLYHVRQHDSLSLIPFITSRSWIIICVHTWGRMSYDKHVMVRIQSGGKLSHVKIDKTAKFGHVKIRKND